MADKITSIKGLKKAIEYAFVKGEFARENVMFALKQFEANVRERIEFWDSHKDIHPHPTLEAKLISKTAAGELRRVLGEGAA